MASTSISKLGGVVIVTQVIRQDDTSIQLQPADTAPAAQTPPPAAQTPPPATQTPPTSPKKKKKDNMATVYLMGEPQGLGVVQIVVGVLCLLFSLTAVISDLLLAHAPLCLAATFVVSGSLTLAALRRTSVRRVCASLVWNLISVLVSLGGVAYVCWLLAAPPLSERLCDGAVLSSAEITKCRNSLWRLDGPLYGSLGVILVLMVLQVCVAITVSVFSVKTIRRCNRYTPIMVDVGDEHTQQ